MPSEFRVVGVVLHALEQCLNPTPVTGSAGRRSSVLGCFGLVGLRRALEGALVPGGLRRTA